MPKPRWGALWGHETSLGQLLLPCTASYSRTSSQMTSPQRQTRGIGAGLLALIGYLVLTIGMIYPLVLQFSSAIPGDSFDGWQNAWNLWWIKTALVDKITWPWFTDLLYHPTGVSLLFHTLNAFNGITFLPVQLAWGLLPAYNAVVAFSFAAGGLGAYLLVRQVLGAGSSRLAAFLAGAIFTFSPYHFAHLLGHMQLIALEWLPFYALYTLRALRAAETATPRRIAREGALAAFFLVLVALCDWYYAFYCLLFTAVAAVWFGLRSIRAARGKALLCAIIVLTAMGLAAAAVLSPLLIPMVREARQTSYMVPDPAQSRLLSADLLAFVTPQGFHPVWGEWARRAGERFTSTISEYTVFAGYTVLGLTLAGLFARWRRGMKGLWLGVALTFLILSLGPVLHAGGRVARLPGGAEIALPYAVIARLPFLNIMRSISRLDVVAMLALGVLAAGGLNLLMGKRAGGVAIGALALGLVLLEFLPAPYPMSPPDTPAWYRTLADDDRSGAVLNLPANWDRPGYLLYQTEHRKPLSVAYISRDDPRTLTERAPVLQHFRHLGPDIIELDLQKQGQQVLSDLDVRWVVLDRYKMPGGREREYTEAAAAEIFGDQAPAFEDERLTVYEVEETKTGDPYVVLGDGWGPFDAATGARAFTGKATLLVMADRAGKANLDVVLVPGDTASIDSTAGERISLKIALTAGANLVTLNSDGEKEARVTRVRVSP